jgi:K+-transporting ATPase ATPase B chain
MAEARGKAQADALRKRARHRAHLVTHAGTRGFDRRARVRHHSADLRKGASCSSAGELSERRRDRGRLASVRRERNHRRERAVIRESGGDRSAGDGRHPRACSDWIVVRVHADPGADVPRPHDRRWSRARNAAEDTERDRARTSPAGGLTIIFLLATVTLCPFSIYSVKRGGQGTPITMTVPGGAARLSHPDDIGGPLSAIGIAGMDRHDPANVIAMSGRRVEAAGDVDVPAPRQDRNDHARQPPGDRLHPRATASPVEKLADAPSWRALSRRGPP